MILVNRIKHSLSLFLFRKKWRKKNPNNETVPVRVFPIESVIVGRYSYGSLDIYTWGAPEEKLEIGSFVSIASGVKFLLGGNHRTDTLLTFPVKVKFLNEKREATSKGPIIVEDDVWIGMDAMILSGTHIGRGAVIGARTVITKDVPPYSIVIGNPSRVVSYRFPESIISQISRIPIDRISKEYISLNKEYFINPVEEIDIVRILSEKFE